MTPTLEGRLPTELWLLILRRLTLRELIPMVCVCVRLRQIALGCKAYWYDIQLEGDTDPAIQFFLSLLRNSGSRPCKVLIHEQSMWDRWPSLLAAVAEHLHRIDSLSLLCHPMDAQLIIELVRRPIPNLRVLRIYIGVDAENTSRSEPILPSDILAGNATNIKTAVFHALTLPPLGFCSLFPNLKDVTIAFTNHAAPDTLETLRTHFPACTQLSLCSPTTFSDELRCSPDYWTRIQKLEIGLRAASQTRFLRLPGIRDIPTVRVVHPALHSVWECISHLSGP